MTILFSLTLSFFSFLLFDTLHNTVYPHLVRTTGLSIWHPNQWIKGHDEGHDEIHSAMTSESKAMTSLRFTGKGRTVPRIREKCSTNVLVNMTFCFYCYYSNKTHYLKDQRLPSNCWPCLVSLAWKLWWTPPRLDSAFPPPPRAFSSSFQVWTWHRYLCSGQTEILVETSFPSIRVTLRKTSMYPIIVIIFIIAIIRINDNSVFIDIVLFQFLAVWYLGQLSLPTPCQNYWAFNLASKICRRPWRPYGRSNRHVACTFILNLLSHLKVGPTSSVCYHNRVCSGTTSPGHTTRAPPVSTSGLEPRTSWFGDAWTTAPPRPIYTSTKAAIWCRLTNDCVEGCCYMVLLVLYLLETIHLFCWVPLVQCSIHANKSTENENVTASPAWDFLCDCTEMCFSDLVDFWGEHTKLLRENK